ncbi:hypothetical protein LTR95_001022 [Oleoguttula sp. CCFEE 5521]
MATHLGKRKRSRKEDSCQEQGAEEKVRTRLRWRRNRQQPTPPDSVQVSCSHSPRNIIGFNFKTTPFVHRTDEPPEQSAVSIFEADRDQILSPMLVPPLPSPLRSSLNCSNDPEFGAKVCKRFEEIQQERERKYGFAIAAAFEPGRTPSLAREAEELAQMELKRRFMEDTDTGDSHFLCDHQDNTGFGIAAPLIGTEAAKTVDSSTFAAM